MKKQLIKDGQIIIVKCKEHGTHTGEVASRDEDRVLIEWDKGGWFGPDSFVAPLYDVIKILKQPIKNEKEIKLSKSRFI